jgi:transcriptional regulator with XRE-family HTH domain
MITPKKVVEIREEIGVSRAELAREAKLNVITVDRYEKDKTTNPAEETVGKIEQALNRMLVKAGKTPISEVIPIKPKKDFEVLIKDNIQEEILDKRVSSPRVVARVTYTAVAEVVLDVNEEIVSEHPLTTQRVYSNPQNVKVISNSLGENDFKITKIVSEYIEREPQPAYAR